MVNQVENRGIVGLKKNIILNVFVGVIILVSIIFNSHIVASDVLSFNFTEAAGNPLFGGPTSGVDRAYQPYVIKIDGMYNMWYGDGENARYTNSTYADFNDAQFPGIIVSGTTASQPYKFTVYYNSDGWTLGENYYSQKLVAYYTDAADGWVENPKIAVSDNGINWTFVASTTGVNTYPWPGAFYRLSVLYEGNNTWKGYGDQGNAIIQYYTSTNGINWTGVAQDILSVNNPQSWESSAGAISPYVFKSGNNYIMTYSAGATDNNQAIGMAYSHNGINFTKYSTNPVFNRDDGVSWRTDRTYNGYIMDDDGLWRMYFQGRDSTGNYSVGMSTSVPVVEHFTLNESSSPVFSTLLPDQAYVIKDNLNYKLYYAGNDFASINLAQSSDGIIWAEYDNNPIISDAQYHSNVKYYEIGFTGANQGANPSALTMNYRIWYQGLDGHSIEGWRYAESPDGINWYNHIAVSQFGPSVFSALTGVNYGIADVVYNSEASNSGTDWKFRIYANVQWEATPYSSNELVVMAFSANGYNWTGYDPTSVGYATPIFAGTLDGVSFDNQHIGWFKVIKNSPTDWEAFYSGGNDTTYQALNGIGYANSTDGISWTRVQTLFTTSEGVAWRDKSVWMPSVVKSGRNYQIYFLGSDNADIGSSDWIQWKLGRAGLTSNIASFLKTMSISPNTSTITAGHDLQLNVTSLDQFDDSINVTIDYTTNDSSVASVNSTTGLVSAIAAGTALISAKNGTVNATVIINVLNSTQQCAKEENLTVWADTSDILLNEGCSSVEKIIINSTIASNKTINLDMSAIMTNGTQNNISSLIGDIILERETPTNNYTAVIFYGTVISGNSTWNGFLELPKITTLASDLGTVETVIELGSTQRLNFSKAVKVTLGKMTGKKALWSDSTGTYAISLCSDATSNSSGSLASRECYIDDGTDLIIWTYHFTKFGAYSLTSSGGDSGGGSSGGGGGGGSGLCTTKWVCTSWSSCVNNQQTRVCNYSANACEPLGIVPLESQTCGILTLLNSSVNNAINKENLKNNTAVNAKGITGFAVLGNAVASPVGIIIFVLIGLGVILWIIVKIRKRKKKERYY